MRLHQPKGAYARKLRRKFARSAIERFGLGVVEHTEDGPRVTTGTLPADDRRRMRNARKQERHAR